MRDAHSDRFELSDRETRREQDQPAAPMAPRARGIGKSVHSPEHGAFCDLMVEARKKAGLTQHEVAKRLRNRSARVYISHLKRLSRIAMTCRAGSPGASVNARVQR
jgi:hypothetical protein